MSLWFLKVVEFCYNFSTFDAHVIASIDSRSHSNARLFEPKGGPCILPLFALSASTEIWRRTCFPINALNRQITRPAVRQSGS